MAGGRARESLRALRDRPWGAKPNGLGPLRQLGWTPPLWFRPDHVLLAHARVAHGQGETIEAASTPVAEVAPVHLALLPRAGLEAHEGSLAPFLPPWGHRLFQLRVAAIIAAAAYLVQ